jgi:hypothetical protein
MKLNYEKLIKDREGFSGNYSCPKYISTDAIIKLFDEAGLNPEPKAVGVLGDILENFALSILDGHQKNSISASELKNNLKNIVQE